MRAEGGPNRILVTSGVTRVDTEVLRAAALRLGGAAERLALLAARCQSAQEEAGVGAALIPEGRAALLAIEGTRGELARAGETLAGLAERVAFAAALYQDAEARTAALARADPLASGRAGGSGAPGAEEGAELVALGERLGLRAEDAARRAHLLVSFLAFLLGRSGPLASARAQGGVAAIAPSITGARAPQPDADSAGDEATIAAAREVAEWWGLLGALLSGSVRGIEVATGAGLAPGNEYRLLEATGGGGGGARGLGELLVSGLPGLPFVFGLGRSALSSADAAPVLRGRRWARSGSALSAGAAGEALPDPVPVRAVPTPVSPSALLGELSDIGGGAESGRVKILRHDTPLPDGTSTTSWSVVVRGTQKWAPGAANPQDMTTNLEEVAGIASDQSRAILAAMEMAGIAPGEPVEFVGHSQGGIVAARLAADPALVSDYAVVSVLTAGSPIAGSAPAPGVGVLALENTRDLVPALDGADNAEGVITVRFDGEESGGKKSAGVPKAHDASTYRALLESIEDGAPGADEDPGLAEVRGWEEARRRRLGFTDRTRTSAIVFETRRLRAVALPGAR